MENARKNYNRKRGQILVKNLQKRHHEAYYCDNKEEALAKALELIPEGSSIGWGGAYSAQQIGLMAALDAGNYTTIDRDKLPTPEEKLKAMRACFDADYFVCGANALSLDGEMVTIDGNGNRMGMMVYGPKYVLVIAGMNKVCDSLEAAVERARTVAAPMNQQRFQGKTPCTATGTCADCLSENCICNQILITRNGRIPGRFKFIIVGEELGY